MKRLLLTFFTLSLVTFTNFSFAKDKVSPKKSKTDVKKEIDPEKKLKIFSDKAKYDRKNKLAIVTGNVKIIQDNVTVYTSKAIYDEENKISTINTFSRVVNIEKEEKRKTDISSNKMIVFHRLKKVHMEDDVKFDREEDLEPKPPASDEKRDKIETAIKKSRTVINSEKVDYWTETGDAIFEKKVVFLQKEKKATADKIFIKNDQFKNTETVTLDGNAKIIQIRGDWLEKEKIIENKEKDIEKERLVKERIEIIADKIVIFQKTNDIVAIGNVKVIQQTSDKQREATGKKGVYIDTKKTLTLTGDVDIKRENLDSLKAEKAVFYTDTEDFKAFGANIAEDEVDGKYSDIKADGKEDKETKVRKQVETEFLIPDEENPDITPVGTPAPEFNLDDFAPQPVDGKKSGKIPQSNEDKKVEGVLEPVKDEDFEKILKPVENKEPEKEVVPVNNSVKDSTSIKVKKESIENPQTEVKKKKDHNVNPFKKESKE